MSWYFLSWSQRLLLLSVVKSIHLTLLETLLLLLFLLSLLLFCWKHANVQLVQIIYFFILLMLRKQSQKLHKITYFCIFLHPFPLIYLLSNSGVVHNFGMISLSPGSWLWCNHCALSRTAWLRSQKAWVSREVETDWNKHQYYAGFCVSVICLHVRAERGTTSPIIIGQRDELQIQDRK